MKDYRLQGNELNNPLADAKLTRDFIARLQAYLDEGYRLEQILARYIVVWKDKETGEAFRVVLPELQLRAAIKERSQAAT